MIKRTMFIGDVHGCLLEFNELIDKVNYNPKEDRLILVGDLIDRGPDSAGVIKRARELNLECVCGNHDYKFLKWFRSQGSQMARIYDQQDYYSQLSEEDIQYIANMPLYIEMEDVIVLHAGVKPNISISNQKKEDLMYLRYTDDNRKMISLKTINKIGKVAAGARFWTEFGPFGKSIVYGHQVWSEPHIDKFDDGTACYGIDTGCCFGGMLTALIWETKEIVQIKAKKVHYKSDFDIR